jgi:hypothetical protein
MGHHLLLQLLKTKGITNTRESKLFLNVSFVYVFRLILNKTSQYNPTILFYTEQRKLVLKANITNIITTND